MTSCKHHGCSKISGLNTEFCFEHTLLIPQDSLCPICIDNSIPPNFQMRCCKQFFHSECLKKYQDVDHNISCPTCRSSLTAIKYTLFYLPCEKYPEYEEDMEAISKLVSVVKLNNDTYLKNRHLHKFNHCEPFIAIAKTDDYVKSPTTCSFAVYSCNPGGFLRGRCVHFVRSEEYMIDWVYDVIEGKKPFISPLTPMHKNADIYEWCESLIEIRDKQNNPDFKKILDKTIENTKKIIFDPNNL